METLCVSVRRKEGKRGRLSSYGRIAKRSAITPMSTFESNKSHFSLKQGLVSSTLPRGPPAPSTDAQEMWCRACGFRKGLDIEATTPAWPVGLKRSIKRHRSNRIVSAKPLI